MSFGDLSRINTNLQALDSVYSLNKTSKKLGEVQTRLSSGIRINKAEDDAAGFSIASKLNAKITGLTQALANTGDGKSVLQIAEKNLGTILDKLTVMKQKATQAANDTYGTEERTFLQDQVRGFADDIDQIVGQTEFNGRQLLDGNYVAQFQTGAGTTASDSVTADLTGPGFSSAGLGVNALDLSDFTNSQAAIDSIDNAIGTINTTINTIGVTQSSLTAREEILNNAIISNNAAKSRILDTDFAKEQSDSLKLQILQQTNIAALAQANAAPQAVLGFLG
jgi:flagellin